MSIFSCGVSGQVVQPVSVGLAEDKLGCVRSATGWLTFQINDQKNSFSHPPEGTLN